MSGSKSLHPAPGKPRVLVVDEDIDEARLLAGVLHARGIPVLSARRVDAASQTLQVTPIDVVVASMGADNVEGDRMVATYKAARPLCQVILIASRSRVRSLVEMIEGGASDFFLRPITDPAPIADAIEQSLRKADRWRTVFVGPDPQEKRV